MSNPNPITSITQSPITPKDLVPRGFITAPLGQAWVAPNLLADIGNALDYCNISQAAKAPGDLGYPKSLMFKVGVAGTTYGPMISPLGNLTAGGPPVSYAISGTLANGLSFNTTTGVLSGTPTVSGLFNHTVTATNASGTSTQLLVVGINPLAPTALAYTTNATYTVGVPITSNTPTPTPSNGQPARYILTAGVLPAGLSLNTYTGAITGTPTTSQSATAFTVQGYNVSGSINQILSFTVNPAAPLTLGYKASNSLKVGVLIAPLTPTITGGTPSGYALQAGTLPTGLSLNTTTGAITGTPSVIHAAVNVTVRGSNVTGYVDQVISFTIIA